MDNDNNGDIDCDDANCAASVDCGSAGETDCQDGADNDANGLIDCDDPGCMIDPVCGGAG